ncbi:MAG: ferrous iron transport protein [Thermodesulfobacteriota bacterium]|nr:ferrous iron transport protein [Thermodesulfobacteriota bacterium]
MEWMTDTERRTDMTVVPMRRMRVNQRGRIRAVNAHGELGRRLRDMGLVPGTDVMIVGRAPLRDPVAVRLKGFTMTLRNSEADFILVDTEN